jgi:hypothetical protein
MTPTSVNLPSLAATVSRGDRDCVFYLEHDWGHVHMLLHNGRWSDTGSWSDRDLTATTSPATPAARGSALAATAVDGGWRVFFLDEKNHVHVLASYGADDDLTARATPPATPAARGSALAATAVGGAWRLFFLDEKNHVHVLSSFPDHWTDSVLTPTATPAAAGSPLAAAAAGTDLRVFFLDANSHVRVLRQRDGRWLTDVEDLTDKARPTVMPKARPAATSPLAATVTGGAWRVFFLDTGGDVHVLWHRGDDWLDTDLRSETQGRPPPLAVPGQPPRCHVYRQGVARVLRGRQAKPCPRALVDGTVGARHVA